MTSGMIAELVASLARVGSWTSPVAAVLVIAFVGEVVHQAVGGCGDLRNGFRVERVGDDEVAVGVKEFALFWR